MIALPPVIYIAGPFRGPSAWDVEQNIRRAEETAFDVWGLGAAALCPHTNTRFFDRALPDHVWLNGDLALLAKCDGIFMLGTWMQSQGAINEHTFAVEHEIPVFYNLGGLVLWLKEWGARAGR